MKKILATMLALVMALTMCSTVWAEGTATTSAFNESGVATVSNEAGLKAALTEAKTATTPVTIDLNNTTYNLSTFTRDLDAYIHIEANVTLKNGTFDISGVNCGSGFSGIISIKESASVTFEDVTFVGNSYKSAGGVIVITDIDGETHFCTLTLKDCYFDLKNEQDTGAASIIYGTGITNCKVVIDNCEFTLENTNRIFIMMTIDMKNSVLTDNTTNESAEHAFRNVAGEIKSSEVSISGTHETGIKNDVNSELKVTNSTVALSGARTGDLVLAGGASVKPDAASNLTYTRADGRIVTLTLNDGDWTTMIPVAVGGTVNLADYTRTKDGCTFSTWVNTGNGGTYNGEITLTDNLTLNANWSENEYDITYNLDGGTNATSNPATYTYGTGVTGFAAPTKSGYTFTGWVDSNGNAVTSIGTDAFGNVTLTATWNRKHRAPVTVQPTTETKAESPKTFDAGIAVYGVMAVSSVLGMGYVGKKKF